MLMQIAHAIDMVNHLPDPRDWPTDHTAFAVSENELRLLRHAARESWSINARLLSQFFLGDRNGIGARDYLPGWKPQERDVLGPWMSTASEHVAHFSPSRALDPVRELSADERTQVTGAINREARRFAHELTGLGDQLWAQKMSGYLVDFGLLARP
jgi:hypothetical protein